MKSIIISLCGTLMHKLHGIYEQYAIKIAKYSCSEFGKNSVICYPYRINGYNPYTKQKYIHIGNGVSIGANSTLFATRAHLYIGDKTFSGPNLTIMTGDHPYDVQGRFIADNLKYALKKEGMDISKYDSDVIIREDVWIGCNVTILKGVSIGRGTVVAAGSVVTRSLPPYCVAGGVPARVIKYRWSIDEIIEHEMLLYPVKDRLLRNELEQTRIDNYDNQRVFTSCGF